MAIWKHDCVECQYLGTLIRSGSSPVDFYSHNSTLIARTGDDGPDYVSADSGLAPHLGYLLSSYLLSVAHILACMPTEKPIS